MRAWFSCTGAELLARDPADTEGRLAKAQQDRGFGGTMEQGGAWAAQIAALRHGMAQAGGQSWTVALEYELLRLEKRIDAVILTDRAILALEFKTAAPNPAAMAEAEDYALDLRDFHAGSRRHAIVPVLVSTALRGFQPPAQPWLLPTTPTQPIAVGADALGDFLLWVQGSLPAPTEPLDGAAWLAAPYRPVPTIIEAATMLYARAGVAEIATARADAASLNRTSAAILAHVEAAKRDGARVAIFVTGIPGAGKTLCGLNAVFGPAGGGKAAFLTGNVPLVGVLREALARDAMARGIGKEEAHRRTKAALQNVHRFLEDGSLDPAQAPPEHLIVFDEAQRAWDEAKARQGTQNKPSKLTMSEPAHTLDIMSRPPGWSAIVALIGNGQEINTGEAGLAEWGRVLDARGDWRAVAASRVLGAEEPAQRLAATQPSWLVLDDDLHLDASMRSVREPLAAEWVDAVLRNDAAAARRLADGCDLPFFLTRDLQAMREALRGFARGKRRAGLLRAAGARRLRAEGLDAEVEAKDVPNWFLNAWPDVRASDALEAAATEYACQGLELDVAGLAWGGDFLRVGPAWRARNFSGRHWQKAEKDFAFIRNTYRVLLTRARYETVIWVPPGCTRTDAWHDPTRPAAEMDAVAAFLRACGARPLPDAAPATPTRAGLLGV